MSGSLAHIERAKIARQLTMPVMKALTHVDPSAPGRQVVMGQLTTIGEGSKDDGSFVRGYLLADDGATKIPFVGADMPGLQIGTAIRLKGEWQQHHEFGWQFRAEEVQSELPTTRAGITRYIEANVKGCGPARAGKIIDHLGLDSLALLLKDPAAVLAVFPGKVGHQQREVWCAWAEAQAGKERAVRVEQQLVSASMTPRMAQRVLRHFKTPSATADVVRLHPYRLVEVPGIGFKRADQIARAQGVAVTDPSRIAAGVVHALSVAMETGHSGVPRPALVRRAMTDLEVKDPVLVEAAIESALAEGTLVFDSDLLFLPRVLRTERELAAKLVELQQAARPLTTAQRALVQPIIEGAAPPLSATQQRAVWKALESGVFVLTGRPGSGKTTTTRTFTACCAALQWSVELAAPTGKAAARAAEVTKLPAKTVHRLIGGIPGSMRPEPLTARVVVLDEVSMADLELVAWLAKNVEVGVTLVLVGDQDQLPSVGHGAVLADILASGAIPSESLVEIFRQAQGSRIITNAHRLLDGKPLLLDNADGSDFLFADVTLPPTLGPDGFPLADDPDRSRREQEAARQRLVKALDYLVTQCGAVPVRDVQVLTPMRTGQLGVDEANRLLQRTLNPDGRVGPAIGGQVRVRVGDRVIQTKNDYSIKDGLFNGEQGEVVGVDDDGDRISVQFDDRTLALQGSQLNNLRLAWAITVHRSQGSEFPFTILLYHTSHYVMLEKSLLYTAITRAKKRFIVIGNRAALEATARQAKRPVVRGTGLAQRLALAGAALAPAPTCRPGVGGRPAAAPPAPPPGRAEARLPAVVVAPDYMADCPI